MLSGADQLHLTAGYILYNYVCDEYKSWILRNSAGEE